MLTEEERRYLDDKYALRHIGGDNALLSSVMRYIRKNRPLLNSVDAFSVFETNDLIQIWLQTPACRFSQEGKCTICNYWSGQEIPGLITEMEETVFIPENINTILINTCGSCLDPGELAVKEQERLFEWLNKQPVDDIILETHMSTLSEDAVQRVRRMIPNKNLFFEIGQESTDSDVQFYSLNKPLPKRGRDIIIDRIHRYGIKSIVNVVLGAPFLSREEQICDAVDSITTLLQEGADYIMLFPINIKPNTLVHFLHDMGMYISVDGSMIASVLDALPEEFLPKVGVAWYGEHQEPGVIPPYIPEMDRMEFNRMVAAYNSSDSMDERKQQLKMLLDKGGKWKLEYRRETENGCLMERLDKAYQVLCEMILDCGKGNRT
ncbi:MAG: hypothetical protein HDR28_12280 [Lachnospiraceae bacterium]|nr:hypothetical protein [Lachnospiraceae bacterium]